ncbi:MAG: SurA N-terminal domain-containing protein [Paludibacteraceae bacterium]|nr:SurA N-terminal domain-containing protein [Paludibacteraceae bacterium]
MATLQKIRNHGVILLIIVGAAMLAFILGDFLNSGSSFFHRDREYVGEIAGHKVHYTDYEAARERLTEVYKIESGRSDFDEETTTQIRNQVWQMMLMDYTLQAQAKEIGMDVTADELSELCIGAEPHQIIRSRRAFYDENGQFSRDNLVRFLHSIENTGDDNQSDNLRQAQTYWLYWENAVRLTRMQEKYTELVKNLITANKLDAKYAFDARQQSVDVRYVMRPYSAVADSLVKVSNSDIKALYNKQKQMYKQTPNRSLEYVCFDIKPSQEDFQTTEKLMNDLKQEFATTDDIALVVNTNSDIMYDGRNYSEDNIPEMYKDFAFGKNAHKDAVTDITFEDDTYRMARLMDCGYSMPDSVQLKLIAAEEGQEDHELGWFTESMLQKQIAEPAFAGKKGTRFNVAAGLGEQTFEIMDVSKATPKVKLAILERKVTPSSRTYSVLYNEAKQFVVNNQTEDLFRGAAAEAGMNLQPAYALNKNTDKVADLKSSRPIVRWAFEAKEGQVSDVFECGDKFVVALLTEISEDEYRPMKDVQGELTLKATNRKKAALISKEMEGLGSLEEAAQKFNTTVQNAEAVTLSSYRLGNGGSEPAVIGKALAINANTLSRPVEGRNGVYMLVASDKKTAEAEFNEQTEVQQLNNRYAYLPYQLINMVEEKSEVVDNRYNFQ